MNGLVWASNDRESGEHSVRNFLISGSVDCSLRVWNISTGLLIMEILNAHSDRISDLSISNDSKFVLSSSYDKTVKIWAVEFTTSLTSDSSSNISVDAVGGSNTESSPTCRLISNNEQLQIATCTNGNQVLIWSLTRSSPSVSPSYVAVLAIQTWFTRFFGLEFNRDATGIGISR